MAKKCKQAACFTDSDCRHGYCGACCHHRVNSYHSTRSQPRNYLPHLGVEIEATFRTPHGYARATALGAEMDSSVMPRGLEFKRCGTYPGIVRKVAKLAREISDRGGTVNRTCGLHVHIDTRGVFQRRRLDLLDFCKTHEERFFSLIPQHRRENSYVARIREGYDHCEWMNLRRDTIECRLHPGTLNPHKLSGWLAVMNTVLVLLHSQEPMPLGWTEFLSACDETGRNYLRARINAGGVLADLRDNTEGPSRNDGSNDFYGEREED